jgi:hypothetical protein
VAACERGTASVQLERRDDGYLLSITPRADLSAGKHEFAITLSGTAADGQPLPEGRLPAMVQVLAPVAATPAFVPLGLVTLGRSATREVELHARSGHGFEVVEIRAPQESGLSARPAAHASRYTLEQRAVPSGHHRGVVTFVVRVEGSQQPIEIPVQVAYQAAEPAVAAATEPKVAP